MPAKNPSASSKVAGQTKTTPAVKKTPAPAVATKATPDPKATTKASKVVPPKK
ncbi:hypothetical protein BYT27DRAFT_7193982 [Phlegmacium glaucopus]|nr:hypothetical protein BYT27DRAFT_7193982 [Phlegmacium glaucopus]